MAIKSLLLSPSFTVEAAKLITQTLNTYNCIHVKDWPEDSPAEAVIVRSKDPVNHDFIKRFPNLKIVVTATSGFDHIDLSLAKKTDIKFCYSPNANVSSASELTLWHILNLLKKGSGLSGKWDWRSPSVLGRELQSLQVCLIGLGRIGKAVAKKLQAFECKVSAHDPYLSQKVFTEVGVERLSLEDSLKKADVLSLHCPLTAKTRNLINQEALNVMKKNAVLINLSLIHI